MGPIMLDVQSTSLTSEDRDLLQHPLVGGLILFSRNYQSPEQITSLITDIRRSAKKELLIAVDHEGGRVQRFKDGFSKIPAMGALWKMANGDMKNAEILAQHCGTLMALEVQAVGIDISFAPVLDLDGISEVIGDRGFHTEPSCVCTLAAAFINGMQLVGMAATGKHFPGHGSVKADSHLDLPIDPRRWSDISKIDLSPFKSLIEKNKLAALMPAHIVFPDVDNQAVGFSRVWLQDILRQSLGFEGVIFSDDLSMAGASSVGGFIERAEAAQQAGCDMLLLCNSRQACIEVIDNANIEIKPESSARLKKLLKTSTITWADLSENSQWRQSRHYLAQYN